MGKGAAFGDLPHGVPEFYLKTGKGLPKRFFGWAGHFPGFPFPRQANVYATTKVPEWSPFLWEERDDFYEGWLGILGRDSSSFGSLCFAIRQIGFSGVRDGTAESVPLQG